MTLRAPPKPPHATANLVGRFVGLIVLLSAFAGVVWVAATNQQVPLLERSNPLINPPGEHVSVSGFLLHVQTFGDGADVTLLVHDDSMAGGALVAPLAESLAEQGRTVLVPDLVGFGLSSRLGVPGRTYSSIGQAETLAAYLGEAGVRSVEVVGVGWGGVVAADLAVSAPTSVSRLVLIDVPSLTPSSSGWHSLESLPFGVGKALAYHREGASTGAEDVFRQTCPGLADCTDPMVVEAFRRAATVPGTAASIRSRRASPAASVAADRIGDLGIPVLVISTTDAAAVEKLTDLLDGAEVEIAVGAPAIAAAIAR